MSVAHPLAVRRGDVLAFRLKSQHLTKRLSLDSLLQAAGACGIQETPPGSAVLSLHARVAGLTPDAVFEALAVEKSLVQMWSLRGAPYLFPTCDAPVFTTGLLPEDEESLRFFILGIEQALSRIGMTATEVVERTAVALHDVLDHRVLANKQRLDNELACQVALQLTAGQLAAWQTPSPYGPNQSLGEALVSFALRPLSLQGLIAFAPRRNNEASFVRTDQWLGQSLPEASTESRAELVRRYLHCFGPSTPEAFAQWAGITPAQANRMWRLVEGELAEVNFGSQKPWLNQEDVPLLISPPSPMGVRLLPPHDPYLALRDRATLVPDKAIHRAIWRRSGNPGVVLADGELVGTWRPEKRGSRLSVTVELFAPVSAQLRSECEAEAATLAPFRGCAAVDLRFVNAT
jgi:hypothetical protein